MKNYKKILVVDDQLLIRKGIINILQNSLECCQLYEATNVQESVDVALEKKPDLILMDLELGDGTGAEACRIILDRLPSTHVLFLSMYNDKTSVLAAMLSGASGYLNKKIEPDLLLQAISLTFHGFTIFNKNSLTYILSYTKTKEIGVENNPLMKLSSQQNKVLELVTLGMTNKEIGKAMFLSDKTVRNYLTIIFEKLGITKRTEAAVIFTESSK